MNVKANLGAKPSAVRAAHGIGRISQTSRDELQHHIDHMGHMLSEQGPMSITFVHNNTLFGQHVTHVVDMVLQLVPAGLRDATDAVGGANG